MSCKIIIERYEIVNGYSKQLLNIAKIKHINLDVFFQAYKGIEGIVVDRESIYSNCICVDQNHNINNKCYGFDVGILDIDYYSFSSIYNEIIFSSYDFFYKYKENLNNFFLFPTYYEASQFLNFHRQIYEEGNDVEHTDLLSIYRILK